MNNVIQLNDYRVGIYSAENIDVDNPALCEIAGMHQPCEAADILYEADQENLAFNIEKLKKACRLVYLEEHAKLNMEFVEKWLR